MKNYAIFFIELNIQNSVSDCAGKLFAITFLGSKIEIKSKKK